MSGDWLSPHRRSLWRGGLVKIFGHSSALAGSVLIGLYPWAQSSIAGQPQDGASDRLGTEIRSRHLAGSADHVHVIRVDRMNAASDMQLITLRTDRGFHINANPASADYLIPTSLAFAGIEPERVSYPPSVAFKPQFTDDPINVYEGTVVIAASFAQGTLDREPAP
jgi:hypothetical protein